MIKLTSSWAPPTHRPLDVAHVMNGPRPSHFSRLFRFHVVLSHKPKSQKQGRPGNKAKVLKWWRGCYAGPCMHVPDTTCTAYVRCTLCWFSSSCCSRVRAVVSLGSRAGLLLNSFSSCSIATAKRIPYNVVSLSSGWFRSEIELIRTRRTS